MYINIDKGTKDRMNQIKKKKGETRVSDDDSNGDSNGDSNDNSGKYIGVHIGSSLLRIMNTAQFMKEKGANIVQLFVSPLKELDKKYSLMYTEFADFLKRNHIKCVVHASYTINLATAWDEYSAWLVLFIEEIKLANKIGAEGIVVHMGKSLELTQADAYNNMYSSLLYVHNQTLNCKDTKILLETSSGQGSEICFKLEDFAYFFKKLSRNKNEAIVNRFGICVDTCHIFAAGYDLTSKALVYMYLEAFEELIGLRHIKLIHLNDSRKEVGSNVDRHENIGQGKIGKEGLLIFANYFKNLNVPIILETPYEKILDDLKLIL